MLYKVMLEVMVQVVVEVEADNMEQAKDVATARADDELDSSAWSEDLVGIEYGVTEHHVKWITEADQV